MTILTLPNLPSLEERAAAARHGDLEAFAKAVHLYDIEPYQNAWEVALDEEDRVVIVCPPDTYKSTTVQMWVEKQIGQNANIRILWLMNAGEQAEKRVNAVGQTIEQNNVFRRAFNVIPDKSVQWTKSVLFVKRDIDSVDPTLMGCGLNGPYQGLHFDIIIMDDVTNQEDVRSQTTMDLQREKLRGVISDRVVEAGRIVCICTRWGETDLVPTFSEIGYTVIVMPVVGSYPWGPTLSNKRFPLQRIDSIRKVKGDALFNLTYMCNPMAVQGNRISRDHIRYWGADNLPEGLLKVYIGVDPASTTKAWGDPSAIVTVGLDQKTRKIYVLDVWAKRVSVPELEKEIIRRSRGIANLMAVGVETVAFQLSLVQYLRRDSHLPIREVRPRTQRQVTSKMVGIDRDKVSRADYLDMLFSSGRLYIPRPETLPLVDGVSYEAELMSVPLGKHDDRMDATAIAVTIADGMSRQQGGAVKISSW